MLGAASGNVERSFFSCIGVALNVVVGRGAGACFYYGAGQDHARFRLCRQFAARACTFKLSLAERCRWRWSRFRRVRAARGVCANVAEFGAVVRKCE